MKQYAIVHKSNLMPIAFYCTADGAMQRMMFITDSNAFGVFEVDVTIHSVLKNAHSTVKYKLGRVCTINNCLLSVHLEASTAYQYHDAIKSGLFQICDVEYSFGKEIKRPKKEEEES